MTLYPDEVEKLQQHAQGGQLFIQAAARVFVCEPGGTPARTRDNRAPKVECTSLVVSEGWKKKVNKKKLFHKVLGEEVGFSRAARNLNNEFRNLVDSGT